MPSLSLPAEHRRRVRGLLNLARQKLQGRSYWQKFAANLPITGLDLAAVDREIDSALASTWSASSRAILPGLSLRGDLAFYRDHPLGSLPPALIASLRKNTTAPAVAVDPLYSGGFAFDIREPSIAKNVALLVTPHSGDAALSVGGLMACRADLEAHVVLSVFTTSANIAAGFQATPVEEVSRLRSLEESLSHQVLGARGFGLRMWDAELRYQQRRAVDNYPARDGLAFASNPDLRALAEKLSLAKAIERCVERLGPTRIYFPLGLSKHPDTQFLRSAALALAPTLANSTCEVFFYEDLSDASSEHVDVIGEAEALRTDRRRLDAHFVDIRDHFEQKMQAIAAHRSQGTRSEHDERLRCYAQNVASRAGMPHALAERIWRFQKLDPSC